MDDFMQEGFLIWTKIINKYPAATTTQRMALFKRSFANHTHDLADKRRRTVNTVEFEEVDPATLEIASTELPNISEALALMPAHIARAAVALATDPRALTTFLWIGGQWETANQKLCRIAGIGEDEVPLIEQVREYLQDAQMLHRMVKV